MTANWGVPDPAAVDDTETVQHAAFFDTYRMLFNRISLLTNLPFEGLDRISLRNRLGQIGKSLDSDTHSRETSPSACTTMSYSSTNIPNAAPRATHWR